MVSVRIQLQSKSRFSINLKSVAINNEADRAVIRDPRIKKQADGRYRISGLKGFRVGEITFIDVRLIFEDTIAGKSMEQYDATYTFANERHKRFGFDEHERFGDMQWDEFEVDMEEDEAPFYGFIVRGKKYEVQK